MTKGKRQFDRISTDKVTIDEMSIQRVVLLKLKTSAKCTAINFNSDNLSNDRNKMRPHWQPSVLSKSNLTICGRCPDNQIK